MKPGKEVYIKTLGRMGTLEKLRRDGHWEVRVGTVLCHVPPGDIEEKSHKKGRGRAPKKITLHHPAINPRGDRKKMERLDLHGLRVDEAVRQLEKRINDAVLSDVERIEVIHGLGTGRILQAVHNYLKACEVVSNYQLNDQNPGVTIVYL